MHLRRRVPPATPAQSDMAAEGLRQGLLGASAPATTSSKPKRVTGVLLAFLALCCVTPDALLVRLVAVASRVAGVTGVGEHGEHAGAPACACPRGDDELGSAPARARLRLLLLELREEHALRERGHGSGLALQAFAILRERPLRPRCFSEAKHAEGLSSEQ